MAKAELPEDVYKPQGQLSSIAEALEQLREFRKLHPAPAALPPKPKTRQKGKR